MKIETQSKQIIYTKCIEKKGDGNIFRLLCVKNNLESITIQSRLSTHYLNGRIYGEMRLAQSFLLGDFSRSTLLKLKDIFADFKIISYYTGLVVGM